MVLGDDTFCDNYTIDGSRLPLPKDVQTTLNQEHNRIMLVFTSPCICPNPLLTDGWLPWARDAKYIGRDVGMMTMANFSAGLDRRRQAITDFSWAIPCHDALRMIVDWASKQEGGPRIVKLLLFQPPTLPANPLTNSEHGAYRRVRVHKLDQRIMGRANNKNKCST